MTDTWLDQTWIGNRCYVHGIIDGVDVEYILDAENTKLVNDWNFRIQQEEQQFLRFLINEINL